MLQSFEGFSQCIPLSDDDDDDDDDDDPSLMNSLLSNWISLLSPDKTIIIISRTIQNYRVIFVQTISRKYLKPKSLSNTKLLNTVLLLEIFIDYHSNDVPVKILKVQETPSSLLKLKIAYTDRPSICEAK